MSELMKPLWCGRVEFDLVNGRGWRTATVVMTLRRDSVDLYLGDERHLACIEREWFREWLVDPRSPLEEDDVVWSVEAGGLCLSFDRSIAYAVPDDVSMLLTAEV
jgi:hypothetical protein